MTNYIDQIENNKNHNGGGLAVNITGKYESNRHAIARLEKVTFGEAVKELKKKKNGGLVLKADYLLEIYRSVVGEPEWHHAGFLPKQYGGGMKKTYFLNEVPSAEEVQNWILQHEDILEAKEVEKKERAKKQKMKEAFAKKNGIQFYRQLEVPKFGIAETTEMNGKFGWFVVEPHHSYSLTEYYSGIAFKSKRSLEKYLAM